MESIHFPTMIHFVKPISDYAKSVKMLLPKLEEQHPYFRLLFQDEELITLADALLELIPTTHENIKYDSKVIEKISIADMLQKIEEVKRNLIPELHFTTSLSHGEMEQIQLWNFVCTVQHQFATKPWHFDYYELVSDDLYRATFIPQIQLTHCDLTSDDKKIYLTVKWRGSFKSIESIVIPGDTQSVWYATCDSDNISASLNVMRYFLYLQVAAGWGENKWLPGKIQSNGELTATLQLLNADLSSPPAELPLFEAVANKVSDIVVQQFYPKHVEVSEMLEVKLREELARRQQYVAKGLLESEFLDQINQWIDELLAYRESYRKMVSA